jgi:hypothetical protein
MVDNQYWPTSTLKCPERDNWEELPGIWICFDAAGYYREKNVYYSGSKQFLCNSYALKGFSLANLALGAAAINDASLNLSYRLGQNPSETLLLDFFTKSRPPNPRHKFVMAYEDGAVNAVLIKDWASITTATGNLDAFMDIIRKMSRDYPGPKSW